MVLLDTGCLCCTVRGDLVQTLTGLAAKRASGTVRRFSHLIIETTGLADPVPVLQTIVAEDTLRGVYRLHDVVTLVDAVHGEAQLDTHCESVKQAAVADALLITKSDIAAPEPVRALRSRLVKLNPGAELHAVVRGEIDPQVLLRGGVYDPATKSRSRRALPPAQGQHPARDEGRPCLRRPQGRQEQERGQREAGGPEDRGLPVNAVNRKS
jgi:G3E family GTPase